MKTGIELIAEERNRQVNVEGWTPDHDDEEHVDGQMALAASCYCVSSVEGNSPSARRMWPWTGWWKPKEPIRDLVRAGALIAAEIDRLQRLGKGGAV